MPIFQIVYRASDSATVNRWGRCETFNSKNRIVDANGKIADLNYAGHQYQIIEKIEWTFSTPERVARAFLGFLAVICTLGLAISLKSTRNLFTKTKVNIRFGILVE